MSDSPAINYDALAEGATATTVPKPTQTATPSTSAPPQSGVNYDALAEGATATTAPPSTSSPTGVKGAVASVAAGQADTGWDILNAGKQVLMDAANPVDTIEKAAKGIWNQLPPVELYNTTKQALPVIDTYEKARAGGASVGDSIKAADVTARAQDTAGQALQKAVTAFKANPTRETVRAIGDAGALAATFFGGGATTDAVLAPEAAEAGATDATTATESPEMIPVKDSQIPEATPVKDAQVSTLAKQSGIPQGVPESVPPPDEDIQPVLQQGIRDHINSTLQQNGLTPVAEDTSVMDAAQDMADQFQTRSQATFNKVEDITGVNPTTLKDIMAARADQIETATAAGDIEKAGNLQQVQLGDENRIQQAFADAKAQGVDVDQARSDWNKSLRADELSTAVRGSKSAANTVETPNLDPNKLAPRMQKLFESQPGGKTSKLAQLMGNDTARGLVEHAENARDAVQEIKNFVPSSATGQHALKQILDANTTEGSTVLPRGGVKANTDWSGVVKDLGNLNAKDAQTKFGADLAKVKLFASRKASDQLMKRIFFGGSPIERIAKVGAGYELGKNAVNYLFHEDAPGDAPAVSNEGDPTGAVPTPVPSPLDPSTDPTTGPTAGDAIENQPAFKAAASKAWVATQAGNKAGTEAGFTVSRNGSISHIATDTVLGGQDKQGAVGHMQQYLSPDTLLALHVHGNDADGKPSQRDINIAKTSGTQIYVLSRDGLYSIDHTGKTSQVFQGTNWMDSKKK